MTLFLAILLSISLFLLVILIKKESISTTLANERDRNLEACAAINKDLTSQLSALREENGKLKNSLETKEAALQQTYAQYSDNLQNTKKELKDAFNLTANELLKTNSKEFSDNSKITIEQLLAPLKTKIEIFEESIRSTHTTAVGERLTLKTNIQSIVDSTKDLANQTNELKRALKGDIQRQGAWGELILETVLKASGLRKGYEYILHGEGLELQNQDGQRQQPDVIINLPDDKHLIIDSKSSYPHYADYLAAETEAEKSECLKKLLTSIQAHIKTLSEKRYHFSDSLNSPNLTLMFMPIEAMFSLVIEVQKNIFEDAWSKSIVIVSPANLLAILRTIESIWKVEHQNQNALEIAKQGASLYDKFVGLLKDLQGLKTSLTRATTNYEDIMKKLEGRGNIISKIEHLKDLGIKPRKSILKKIIEEKEDEDTVMAEAKELMDNSNIDSAINEEPLPL